VHGTGRGQNRNDVAKEVLSQTDLTSKQAAYFVVNASSAYCPQLSGQLT